MAARIFGGTSTTTTTGTGASASTPLVDSPRRKVIDAQPLASPSPVPSTTNTQLSDISYNISVLGTQLIFKGTNVAIDPRYFLSARQRLLAFRKILDQTHRDGENAVLSGSGQSRAHRRAAASVNLLEQQLKDQQNRFDAGTVSALQRLASRRWRSTIKFRYDYRAK